MNIEYKKSLQESTGQIDIIKPNIPDTEYVSITESYYKGLVIELRNKYSKDTIMEIIIGDKLTITKTVFRPNHDHNDSMSLYLFEDGTYTWSTKFPNKKTLQPIEIKKFVVDY